jgi:hypothetical protein
MTPVDGWPHDPTAAPALSATHNPDGTFKPVEAALDESGTRLLGHVRGLLHTFSTLHLGSDVGEREPEGEDISEREPENDRERAEAKTGRREPDDAYNADGSAKTIAEPVNDEPGPGFDALRARRAERTTDVPDPTL